MNIINSRDRVRAEELIGEIEEIKDILEEAAAKLAFINDTEFHDKHAKIYLISGLQIPLEQGGWMSNNLTLSQWIIQLKKEYLGEENADD